MENKNIKCSSEEHKELKADIYCQECNINMCKTCLNHHNFLFKNHHIIKIDEYEEQHFIGICKDHNIKMEFFCNSHNTLCCSSCITKVQRRN